MLLQIAPRTYVNPSSLVAVFDCEPRLPILSLDSTHHKFGGASEALTIVVDAAFRSALRLWLSEQLAAGTAVRLTALHVVFPAKIVTLFSLPKESAQVDRLDLELCGGHRLALAPESPHTAPFVKPLAELVADLVSHRAC